ncbi:MAG: helix-turn-helix transcriptional regulator [Clostridia bacterium]|jgi:transcriptional regulator with XRE-family HTH domain|nr:helix-turn-helix transcriptional regulator [Clostridia bacterium]
MTLETAIRKRIKELANQNNITINKVSTLAGLTHTTLLAFMNGETHDPRISTLLHICEAFEIDLKEFFNAPIFRNVIDE